MSREPQVPLPSLASPLSMSALGTAAWCRALRASIEEELEPEAIMLHHRSNCLACQLRESSKETQIHFAGSQKYLWHGAVCIHGCPWVSIMAQWSVYRKVLRKPYSRLPISFPHGQPVPQNPIRDSTLEWGTSDIPLLFLLNKEQKAQTFSNQHTDSSSKPILLPYLSCFFENTSQTQGIPPHSSSRSLLLMGGLGNPFWFFDLGILVHQNILSRESRMWSHTAVKVSQRYFTVFWEVQEEDGAIIWGCGHQAINLFCQ